MASGQTALPVAIDPRQQQGTIEPFTGFLHDGKRRLLAGVPASPSRNHDQAVGALFNGLAAISLVDHVCSVVPLWTASFTSGRAPRTYDDRHLVLHDKLHVLFHVAFVDNHVDGKGCRGLIWVFGIVFVQYFPNFVQPHQVVPTVGRSDGELHVQLCIGR